ncbi:MAG: carboxypeptidase regulatory-like domain-containing protein [Blastocatellia bacterium]
MAYLALFIWFSFALPIPAQPAVGPSHAAQQRRLLVTVRDETGVPVPSARVTLTRKAGQTLIRCETDVAGRCEFADLGPGGYSLRVERERFYAASLDEVRAGEAGSLEITLHHEQEIRETSEVVSSPPAIDPAKTMGSESLSSREIVNLPYPTTRDVRNLLRFLPGVVQNATGQLHVNGAATQQVQYQLDGFNITHPVSGLLDLRVSPDALRSIEVLTSRYSAEHGKGSAGVLGLATGMGDDRLRFSATDFIPSFQTRRGVNFNGWTPRATFSGPLRRRRAWFFDAIDGDFNLDIFTELPKGADRNRAWRLNNLAKAQVNLNPTNILSAGFLVNYFLAGNAGLSRFNPLETTRALQHTAYLFTVRQQHYRAGGLLLETGFGASEFRTDEIPPGSLPYVIFPEGKSGNYFKTAEGRARRLQWIANLHLPPVEWRGRHDFKLGMGIDRLTYRQLAERRPIYIRRADETLSREISFTGSPRFGRSNFELSAYAQDRWSLTDRWLVEMGLRLDRDAIVRRTLLAPRLATTYLLTRDGQTRVAAGVGLYYDATNLEFITRPLAGRRLDQFYGEDGQTPRGEPVVASFRVSERELRAPRFVNWSAELERRLPASIYLRLEFIARRGSRGFTFVNREANQTGQLSGLYEMSNEQRDRYTALTLTLRRTFKETYSVFAAYTRSAARSNAVFDFNLDNPLFSPQAGGPLPWDTPNRFISWGLLPLVKQFDLAYSLEWRDGFPFSLINQDQRLVGAPNASRLPAYFSLNLHAERRFRLLGVNLALRAGFNNVTDRENPAEVNNNVDSPRFLARGGVQGRAFVGRIRFLGRK